MKFVSALAVLVTIGAVIPTGAFASSYKFDCVDRDVATTYEISDSGVFEDGSRVDAQNVEINGRHISWDLVILSARFSKSIDRDSLIITYDEWNIPLGKHSGHETGKCIQR